MDAIFLYGNRLKNKQEAIRYTKIAADNGIVEAMINYGRILRLGDGIPSDSTEDIKYFKMAIDQGSSYGMTL